MAGTYTDAKKAYYERNKAKIADKEKAKARHRDYYARNAALIAARRKARIESAKTGKSIIVIQVDPPAPESLTNDLVA